MATLKLLKTERVSENEVQITISRGRRTYKGTVSFSNIDENGHVSNTYKLLEWASDKTAAEFKNEIVNSIKEKSELYHEILSLFSEEDAANHLSKLIATHWRYDENGKMIIIDDQDFNHYKVTFTEFGILWDDVLYDSSITLQKTIVEYAKDFILKYKENQHTEREHKYFFQM